MKEISPQEMFDGQYILPRYQGEVAAQLTEKKRRFLNFFFTNVDGKTHAIRGNMPPVLAAALITRFSRAEETDITEIFWNEFVDNPELGIKEIAHHLVETGGLEQVLAEEHASKLIRRVVDQFGDDSVREQASGYLVVQDASVLLSLQTFRHPLVTGIEASTRYIDWGKKGPDGNYRYVFPEVLKGTEHEGIYKEAMDELFETYKKLREPVWSFVVENNPRPEGMKESVYSTAVKGRVLDNLRKLLPLGIKTNFGLHGRYRALTETVMDLKASGLREARDAADEMATELMRVNPEFVAVVESEHAPAWVSHKRASDDLLRRFSLSISQEGELKPNVEIEVLNEDYLLDIVKGALSFANPSLSEERLKRLAELKINTGLHEDLLFELGRARTNRRHKLPGVLQRVVLRVKFEGLSFGAAKDFSRHRANIDKTDFDWSGGGGVYVPEDIEKIGGSAKEEYLDAQRRAFLTSRQIAKSFPEEAKMLFTHGTKTSMELVVGLGQAFWVSELRSIASGDPEYRRFAQKLYERLIEVMPEVKILRSFVDKNTYSVGRIQEAVRADLKGTSAADN